MRLRVGWVNICLLGCIDGWRAPVARRPAGMRPANPHTTPACMCTHTSPPRGSLARLALGLPTLAAASLRRFVLLLRLLLAGVL